MGGALSGYAFFLWLDPLALFSGFAGAWYGPIRVWTFLPAAGLVVLALASLVAPGAWCYRLCPLGAAQEMLYAMARRVRARRSRSPGGPSAFDRRQFLALAAGAGAGWLARRLSGRAEVIRPPGAVEEARFNAACARCGNCIHACPKRIIYPSLGEAGMSGVLTPVIRIGPGYCAEWCHACDRVCPTHAISHLSLNRKRQVSIGTARVTKSRCLAWAENQYCMVCHEYCPYSAIGAVARNDVNCPEVKDDQCRGCGLCQTVCPATTVAIVVEPRPRQAFIVRSPDAG
jgi:ferredoxin-type protein NapF